MTRRVKDPEFEKLHPRDARGRFRKRGPGDFGWLGKVSDALDPEIQQHKPRRGDLPGEHDSIASLLQSGDLAILSVGKRKRLTQNMLYSYFATHTAYPDDKTGLRVRVGAVKIHEGGGGFGVGYQILDANGKSVGNATRVFLPSPDGKSAIVLHANFDLDKKVQGGGFASRWNRKMEQVYRANGVSEIQLEANIDVGGYAWAKQGYDFYDFDTLSHFVRMRANLEPHTNSLAIRKLIARSTREHWDRGTAPTPLEWAMAGWQEGLKMWPGKQLMLGSGWTGVKKLT